MLAIIFSLSSLSSFTARAEVFAGLPSDDTSRKRFMAYNALGCVICKEDEDWNVIEVSMHDSRTQRRRVPHLNDLYRFSMAALGDKVSSAHIHPCSSYSHTGPHTPQLSQACITACCTAPSVTVSVSIGISN